MSLVIATIFKLNDQEKRKSKSIYSLVIPLFPLTVKTVFSKTLHT